MTATTTEAVQPARLEDALEDVDLTLREGTVCDVDTAIHRANSLLRSLRSMFGEDDHQVEPRAVDVNGGDGELTVSIRLSVVND